MLALHLMHFAQNKNHPACFLYTSTLACMHAFEKTWVVYCLNNTKLSDIALLKSFTITQHSMSLLRWTTQMSRTSSVLLRPSGQLGSFSFTEMNQQWNFTSGFTYTRAAIVWPHVHESLFEVAVNWKVRAKRQEAFNDTRPSCGHFRVRFTLTPTGLTDPQSWKEFLSGAHLNFTRPKRQPQKRAGWRGWVGCGMGWERESVGVAGCGGWSWTAETALCEGRIQRQFLLAVLI